MKTVNIILKVIAALAAVAGVVYVIATYGDKIVAWAKRILGCDKFESVIIHDIPETADDAVEEDIPVNESTQEAPAADNVIAAESDFEG